jgi:tetratricopeptide (TPR) repeat protein
MGMILSAWVRADRLYSRGSRMMRAGKSGEAAKAFGEVAALFPKHFRAHLQQARALSAAGRVSDAVRAAKRAAELAPRSHAPMLLLGQVQYDSGHYEEARKAFAAAARLDPENRMVQAYLGLSLLALGRIEDGARLVEEHLLYAYEGVEARLLALVEQFLWQHRDKARSLEDQLAPDEGGREEGPAGFGLQLASAVRRMLLWPLACLRGRAAAKRLMAEEAFSVRDWDKAIAALQEAEQAGADPHDIAASLGMAHLEAREPEAAAEEFLKLPEEVRRGPETAMMLGAALFDSGRYEEAREPLGIAAQHFDKDFLPAYFRGLCEIALAQPPGSAGFSLSPYPRAAIPWFALAVERLNPHLAEKRFEEMMRVWRETHRG